MAISHAGHNHPSTAAARSACRKSTGNPAVTRIESDGYIADHIRKTAANGAMKARMDRSYDMDEIRGRARTAGRDAQIAAKIKMTGPVARRMARQAMAADNARIQPRRSGARVSARGASCVQAALHIDAHGGRCACGWAAQVA